MKRRVPSAGIVCPVCHTDRGEPEGWIEWAVDEFYDQKSVVNLFVAYRGDLKREFARSAQAISLFGHFQDWCESRHPKKRHECGGLIEFGLYQSVELLTRGLLHVTVGSPTPGLALCRMALEVAVRSVFEEIAYALLSRKAGRAPLIRGTKLRSYLRDARAILRKRSDRSFDRCSLELLSVNWPDSIVIDGQSLSELDPERMGWGRVVTYLEEADVLRRDAPIRRRLDELYDALSIAVHQRKSALEVIALDGKARQRLREEAGWVIRGLPPVVPDIRFVSYFRESVDLVVALVCFAQHRFGLPVGCLPDELIELRDKLRGWDGLPLARETVEIVSTSQPRKRKAARSSAGGPTVQDEVIPAEPIEQHTTAIGRGSQPPRT